MDMIDCTGAATPGVKPLDRDEHAIKLDESPEALLQMEPDNAIAPLCHGNFNGLDATAPTDAY